MSPLKSEVPVGQPIPAGHLVPAGHPAPPKAEATTTSKAPPPPKKRGREYYIQLNAEKRRKAAEDKAAEEKKNQEEQEQAQQQLQGQGEQHQGQQAQHGHVAETLLPPSGLSLSSTALSSSTDLPSSSTGSSATSFLPQTASLAQAAAAEVAQNAGYEVVIEKHYHEIPVEPTPQREARENRLKRALEGGMSKSTLTTGRRIKRSNLELGELGLEIFPHGRNEWYHHIPWRRTEESTVKYARCRSLPLFSDWCLYSGMYLRTENSSFKWLAEMLSSGLNPESKVTAATAKTILDRHPIEDEFEEVFEEMEEVVKKEFYNKVSGYMEKVTNCLSYFEFEPEDFPMEEVSLAWYQAFMSVVMMGRDCGEKEQEEQVSEAVEMFERFNEKVGVVEKIGVVGGEFGAGGSDSFGGGGGGVVRNLHMDFEEEEEDCNQGRDENKEQQEEKSNSSNLPKPDAKTTTTTKIDHTSAENTTNKSKSSHEQASNNKSSVPSSKEQLEDISSKEHSNVNDSLQIPDSVSFKYDRIITFSCWDDTNVVIRGDYEVRVSPTLPLLRSILKEKLIPFYCPLVDAELAREKEQYKIDNAGMGVGVRRGRFVPGGNYNNKSSVGGVSGKTRKNGSDFEKMFKNEDLLQNKNENDGAEENRPSNECLPEDQSIVLIQGKGHVAAFLDVFQNFCLESFYLKPEQKLPVIRSGKGFTNARKRNCRVNCMEQDVEDIGTGGNSVADMEGVMGGVKASSTGVVSAGVGGVGVKNEVEDHVSQKKKIHHTVIEGVLFPEQLETFLVSSVKYFPFFDAIFEPLYDNPGPRTYGHLGRVLYNNINTPVHNVNANTEGGGADDITLGEEWNIELVRVRPRGKVETEYM